MNPLEQYLLAEKLDRDLGSPENPESVMSFASAIALDEQEILPEKELDWLYNWKLQHYYVPEYCSGKFTSFEELAAAIRVMSRRDQTTGISFSTLFWSFLTWLAGNEAQKQRLADFIKDEHGAMCLGYSEKEHGSDLVGGDVTATKVPGGYLLNGEKWPINRATISGVSYILAKTDPAGGARCLSLFMVEKSRLNRSEYYNLPKILTHGIRGCDMSGIGFRDCFISDDMRLGQEGEGLELALKGFQVTRNLCASFSHGAVDTALRTTLKFALNRRLYEQTVFDLPQPKQTLVEAFLDILICDCETISSARGFHVVPEQFSVWASIVKYFVTTQLETAINNLSVVLGSRFYMREEHDSGIFQKLLRDNSIISMFDGSTVVNLHALILQFRQLTKYRAKVNPLANEALKARLETTFNLQKQVPTFIPQKLELFGRGADDALQGLEIAIEQLEGLKNDTQIDDRIWQQLKELSQIVLEEMNAHDVRVAKLKFEYGHHQSSELFDMAKRYCTLHAAASCLHMWIHNRQSLTDFFAKGEWLVLGLHRLVRTLRPMPYIDSTSAVEHLAEELVKLYTEEKLFSIVPFQLARLETQLLEDKNHASSESLLPA